MSLSDDNDVNQNNEDEEEEGRTGTIIGIDLGTTYSECSFVVIVILLWTYSFICIYTTHGKKKTDHIFMLVFLFMCKSFEQVAWVYSNQSREVLKSYQTIYNTFLRCLHRLL